MIREASPTDIFPSPDIITEEAGGQGTGGRGEEELLSINFSPPLPAPCSSASS